MAIVLTSPVRFCLPFRKVKQFRSLEWEEELPFYLFLGRISKDGHRRLPLLRGGSSSRLVIINSDDAQRSLSQNWNELEAQTRKINWQTKPSVKWKIFSAAFLSIVFLSFYQETQQLSKQKYIHFNLCTIFSFFSTRNSSFSWCK